MNSSLRIVPRGGTANQLLQYFFAANVQRQFPDLSLHGYHIPELGLVCDNPVKAGGKELKIKGNRITSRGVVKILQARSPCSLALSGLAFRLSNYASADFYRNKIRPEARNVTGYGDNHIVFHIRGGDILRDAHKDYYPVPFSYIDGVLKNADANPVFLGQLEDSYYTAKLREKYPKAIFSPPKSPIEDFETLRKSSQIAISISSFAWAAAWLSDARRIHFPVAGMLNPSQRPDIDLLPSDDPRYTFYHFEPFKWRAKTADVEMLWENREHDILTSATVSRIKRRAQQRVAPMAGWAQLRLAVSAYLADKQHTKLGNDVGENIA
ncbi:hypothetical protein QTL95_23075 [Rhizobium sp. S152]|uniref:hypothetical protein n=1 Tax=Rhizobium sp. S152 TaxID=3055038 RepID=UPI0025A9338B|nr:hypothetical protein [Rhizobium sp. S152]MDM9628782.1 hypothetical protein [Rhizobium sp. S152]